MRVTEAKDAGFTRLILETAAEAFFQSARKPYEKSGFAYCEPFADYRCAPTAPSWPESSEQAHPPGPHSGAGCLNRG